MNVSPTRLLVVLVTLILTAGADLRAADKLVPLPPSPLTMVDLTNMTFMVDRKGTNMILHITSQTRLFKDGNYAISRDLQEGELVRGPMKPKPTGEQEAVRIFWGKKSPKEK